MLASWEEEILRSTGNRVERLVALGDDGRLLLSKVGEMERVGLTQQELDVLAGEVAVLIHNHPSGGGLTAADFDVAYVLDVREVIAFGPEYRYRLSCIASAWPDRQRSLQTLSSLTTDVRRGFDARVAAGTLTPEDARLRFWHEVWFRFARRSPEVRYTRERR